MHAIIQTGGKQYRVAPGDIIRVAKLPFDVGSALEFPHVLAVFKDGEMLTEAQLEAAKVNLGRRAPRAPAPRSSVRAGAARWAGSR